MSSLLSSDSQISENAAPEIPAAALPVDAALSVDAFDSQTAKAGIKKFAALWPFMPPVALFGIAFAFGGAPLPTPIGNNASAASTSVISASQWVVPASETMVVSRQSASGYAVLRGRLRAPQGEIVTAPSRGQVARVMARVGQIVKAGDPLILISRGTIDAPRSTSPLENWSAQAEDAQIAAAKQQEALESRMRGANERLQNAQARVSDAQGRVAAARALIKRVQNGEEVEREEVAQPQQPSIAPMPTRATGNSNRSEKARADAARESQQLQKTADVAEAKAKAASREAKTADGEMGRKQSQLKAATSALAAAKTVVPKNPPAKTPASKTSAADGESESSAPATAPPRPSAPDTTQEAKAVSAAREALAAAASRAAQAHREASHAQARATELRANANDAARRALEALQVFENENDAPSATTAKTTIVKSDTEKSVGGKSNKITIADAARIARQAMKESDKAIADADRISHEVRGYERPVSGTMRRVDDATRRLQSAQQQIWNTAGAARPNITQVAASASGTLLSLSGMASEISFSQTVAVIGRPDRLEVSVQDNSGVWKSLVVGARVLALVKTDATHSAGAAPTLSPALNSTDGSTPALARPTSAAPNASAAIPINGTPTLARVVAIAPPVKAGAPATIRIAVHNPPQNGVANRNGTSPRAFSAGMGVLFSLSKPGKSVMIRVPSASIRRDENGKNLVAVLSPVPDSTTDTATAQPASACHVEWREVRVGTGDGFNNQILAGLQPGERIALRPDTLYDFTLAYGTQATVRVEQT